MRTEPYMTWNLTLLVVHLLALSGSILLYRRAPCWMQKLVMVGFAFGMGISSLGYVLALSNWWGHWYVISGGWAFSHGAVLLLIFRLIFQDAAWPKSSDSFHNSPT